MKTSVHLEGVQAHFPGVRIGVRSKNGFTLVEMLVVLGVLTIVGVLIVTIFTRTLRSSNKTQILGVIKQNGQSVLEVMDKTIRDSDNVVCPIIVPPANSVSTANLVVVRNGKYSRYRFIAPVAGANGYIQQDNPVKQILSGSQREETDGELRNRICSGSDPPLSPVILTDTNLQTGVSVSDGLFERNRVSGFRDQVTVKFKISPGLGAPPVVAGQIDPVEFQTTVQLR